MREVQDLIFGSIREFYRVMVGQGSQFTIVDLIFTIGDFKGRRNSWTRQVGGGKLGTLVWNLEFRIKDLEFRVFCDASTDCSGNRDLCCAEHDYRAADQCVSGVD